MLSEIDQEVIDIIEQQSSEYPTVQYEVPFSQQVKFGFQFRAVRLQLRRSFNTAHSSSTYRMNFFVRVTYHQGQQIEYGMGESGLPPKKPECYLADIDNCLEFAKSLEKILKLSPQNVKTAKQLFYSSFPQCKGYFEPLMNHKHADIFFSLINQLHQSDVAEMRPTKNAIQYAIFDAWSRSMNLQLSQAIFPKEIMDKSSNFFSQHFTFYTVSHEDHQSMIENAQNVKNITNFIKIKYDHESEKLMQLLKKFNQLKIGEKWIIDLNSSWNPEDWQAFYPLLQKQDPQILNKILYLQQPYKISLSQEDQQKWINIKKQSTVKIIADESFSTVADVPKVLKFSHGVNIKSQKTGGLINSLRAAIECQKQGLEIMFGSMVSTQLACTQCFQLNKFAKYFDVDGALLTSQPAFVGGFQFKEGGRIVSNGKKGLGFEEKLYKDFGSFG